MTGDLYVTLERRGSSWLWLVRFLGAVVALTVVREIFRAIDAGAIVMSSRREPVVRLESPVDVLLGCVFLALLLITAWEWPSLRVRCCTGGSSAR